eukprot:366095-Chlamydomonas_euryale.AAC.23
MRGCHSELPANRWQARVLPAPGSPHITSRAQRARGGSCAGAGVVVGSSGCTGTGICGFDCNSDAVGNAADAPADDLGDASLDGSCAWLVAPWLLVSAPVASFLLAVPAPLLLAVLSPLPLAPSAAALTPTAELTVQLRAASCTQPVYGAALSAWWCIGTGQAAWCCAACSALDSQLGLDSPLGNVGNGPARQAWQPQCLLSVLYGGLLAYSNVISSARPILRWAAYLNPHSLLLESAQPVFCWAAYLTLHGLFCAGQPT